MNTPSIPVEARGIAAGSPDAPPSCEAGIPAAADHPPSQAGAPALPADLLGDCHPPVLWPSGRRHADSFPYVVVELEPGGDAAEPVYTVYPVPGAYRETPQHAFSAIALLTAVTGLPCVLVLGPARSVVVRPDRLRAILDRVPEGGIVVHRTSELEGEVRAMVDALKAIAGNMAAAGRRRPAADLVLPSEEPAGGEETSIREGPDLPVVREEVLKSWRERAGELVERVRPVLGVKYRGDAVRLEACAGDLCGGLGFTATPAIRNDAGALRAGVLRAVNGGGLLDSGVTRRLFRLWDRLDCDLTGSGMNREFESLTSCVHAYAGAEYMTMLDQILPVDTTDGCWQVWQMLVTYVLPMSVSNSAGILLLMVWAATRRELAEYLPEDNRLAADLRDFEALLAALPALAEFMKAGGWSLEFPAEDAVGVYPGTGSVLDGNGDLHCEDGPAMTGPGWAEKYFLEGKEFPKRPVLDPQLARIDDIHDERRPERRCILAGRVGVELLSLDPSVGAVEVRECAGRTETILSIESGDKWYRFVRFVKDNASGRVVDVTFHGTRKSLPLNRASSIARAAEAATGGNTSGGGGAQ